MIGPSVKETHNTCERYGTLTARERPPGFSKVMAQLPTFGKLAERHSLREAVAALIDSIAAGEFAPVPGEQSRFKSAWLSITFHGLSPWATILLNFRRAKELFIIWKRSISSCGARLRANAHVRIHHTSSRSAPYRRRVERRVDYDSCTASLIHRAHAMARPVVCPSGAWPLEMRAGTAAAYCDEPSVDAFLTESLIAASIHNR